MKKIMIAFMAMILATNIVKAQDEADGEKKGFDRERLFTGGSVQLAFFGGQTILGANPVFGYMITDWLDAGISVNYVYTSSRHYLDFDDRLRQTTFGPGVFTRLYPFNFLFLQGQFEHNFITQKYRSSYGETQKYKTDVNSLLLGAGIAQGRDKGSNTFYYFAVLFDVLKNEYSPYVNASVNPDDPSQRSVKMTPILRAGVNIGLFGGR